MHSWSSVLPLTPHAFCISLSVCTVGKLLASFTVGVTVSRLSVEVGLSLLGLYLWWGKPRLVTSRSRLGSSSSQKPLLWPVCWLWLARSQSFLLPSPGSVRLHRYCYSSWHLTASSSSPIVRPLLGYAQSWYCTTSGPGVQHLGWM